jgi:protein-disulfide isomerase
MRYLFVFLLVTLLTTGCTTEDGVFSEGRHYSLDKSKSASEKPEVLLFMSFACPACRSFETVLHDYEIPAGTTFEIIPVSFDRQGWGSLSKAYAVLRQLNVHHEFTMPLFAAVQDDKRNVTSRLGFTQWFADKSKELNIGTEFIPQIAAIYDSENTQKLVDKYYIGEKKYRITGVPTVWVNGNLRLIPSNLAGDDDDSIKQSLFGLIDHTVARHDTQINP